MELRYIQNFVYEHIWYGNDGGGGDGSSDALGTAQSV